MNDCKFCKKFKGDCHNHYKDELGHVDYNFPSDRMLVNGSCVNYEDARGKYDSLIKFFNDNMVELVGVLGVSRYADLMLLLEEHEGNHSTQLLT